MITQVRLANDFCCYYTNIILKSEQGAKKVEIFETEEPNEARSVQ
jgi:hypothetical protein